MGYGIVGWFPSTLKPLVKRIGISFNLWSKHSDSSSSISKNFLRKKASHCFTRKAFPYFLISGDLCFVLSKKTLTFLIALDRKNPTHWFKSPATVQCFLPLFCLCVILGQVFSQWSPILNFLIAKWWYYLPYSLDGE